MGARYRPHHTVGLRKRGQRRKLSGLCTSSSGLIQNRGTRNGTGLWRRTCCILTTTCGTRQTDAILKTGVGFSYHDSHSNPEADSGIHSVESTGCLSRFPLDSAPDTACTDWAGRGRSRAGDASGRRAVTTLDEGGDVFFKYKMSDL